MIAYIVLNALITPKIGLIFWTLLTFVLLLIVLRLVAWKPILGGLKDREQSIENALKQAEVAKQEMGNLMAENEKLLQEARNERDKMLIEAKHQKDALVESAKAEATKERNRILEQAKETIEKEKEAAKRELKEFVVSLSVDVAQKILKKELSGSNEQEALVDAYLNENTVNQN